MNSIGKKITSALPPTTSNPDHLLGFPSLPRGRTWSGKILQPGALDQHGLNKQLPERYRSPMLPTSGLTGSCPVTHNA